MKTFLSLLMLGPTLCAQIQPNTKLSQNQFLAIAKTCAASVPNDTLAAITRTESAFYPFALSINYPQNSARRAGFENSSMLLARQPQNLAEALGWATWFEQHGYTVSIGLMQINTQTARLYRVSIRQLFDPCLNVHTGAAILNDYYHLARRPTATPSQALLDAISAYNSGNSRTGYQNGYVGEVYTNRRPHE